MIHSVLLLSETAISVIAKLRNPNQYGIKVLTYLHFLLPEFYNYRNVIILKIGSGLTSDENHNTLREGL